MHACHARTRAHTHTPHLRHHTLTPCSVPRPSLVPHSLLPDTRTCASHTCASHSRGAQVGDAKLRADAEVEAAHSAVAAERERAEESILLIQLQAQEQIDWLTARVENGTWDAEAVRHLETARSDMIRRREVSGPHHSTLGGAIKPGSEVAAASSSTAPSVSVLPSTSTTIEPASTQSLSTQSLSTQSLSTSPLSPAQRASADREPDDEVPVKPPAPKSKEILRLEEEWEDDSEILSRPLDANPDAGVNSDADPSTDAVETIEAREGEEPEDGAAIQLEADTGPELATLAPATGRQNVGARRAHAVELDDLL